MLLGNGKPPPEGILVLPILVVRLVLSAKEVSLKTQGEEVGSIPLYPKGRFTPLTKVVFPFLKHLINTIPLLKQLNAHFYKYR